MLKTYGLYDKNGNFYIADKPVVVIDDNLIIDGTEYQGTPGFWELIISKKPDVEIYTDQDYENYAKLMIESNALKKGNNLGIIDQRLVRVISGNFYLKQFGLKGIITRRFKGAAFFFPAILTHYSKGLTYSWQAGVQATQE